MRLHTVRMFNEYGCPWPFWGDGCLLEQDDFPLPPELTGDVLAWTREFDLHFDYDTGWPSREQRDAHRREGVRLAARVQEVVVPGVTIDFQYWETKVGGQDLPR
ncbi:hypothetical protein RGB72_11975 [Glutamicibacter protophormiae]|nr:hypothetical protein RGB72_11975 [Glutamicibacter protophormiae]